MKVAAEVIEARAGDRLSLAKQWIEEYVASLEIDLGFESFDREMAEFPGAYARPEGRLMRPASWLSGDYPARSAR